MPCLLTIAGLRARSRSQLLLAAAQGHEHGRAPGARDHCRAIRGEPCRGGNAQDFARDDPHVGGRELWFESLSGGYPLELRARQGLQRE
jgi:hypothetical protein